MDEHGVKRDRTARLLRLQVLLWQNPKGLDINEIARRCVVSPRTVYRDLEAIESELNVPVWAEGSKRGVVEGYTLPPIPFTLPEAMNIFLAAQLLQYFSRWYDPNTISTFMKLSPVVPPPLRKHIQNTIDWMEKQPKNEKLINIIEKITWAWVWQHRVTVRYQELNELEPRDRTIEPYFIEPATPGHSGYIIAYCLYKKAICILKVNRIEQIRVEPDTYDIPPDFNAIDYLSTAWGVFIEGPVETIKLHFKPRLTRPIMEALWHASQKMEPQDDGSLLMTLTVNNTFDFRSWVLQWGDEVEVLEPESLRDQIRKISQSMVSIYTLTNRVNR